jgi:O-antigen/teichoic acid export membrane protein
MIGGLSLEFFVIQIAVIILFSTDNFIIAQLFNPEDVVPYNVAYNYFSIIITANIIIVGPLWSSFTEAYIKNDIQWIKSTVDRAQKIWYIIPVFLVLMGILSDSFYSMWIGNRVEVSKFLTVSMAIFTALLTYYQVYVSFINGIGKIRVQLVTAIFSTIANIPLSILLGKSMGLGTPGVILATTICLIPSVILNPIQYYKLINNKATGIWSR